VVTHVRGLADNIWSMPVCKEWSGIEPKDKMTGTPFNPRQLQKIKDFYFGGYLRWLKFHPLEEHMHDIPQVGPTALASLFCGHRAFQ
jgi:hypothetical protein